MVQWIVMITAALAAASSDKTAAEVPQSPDLTAVRGLTTQHNGRWPPLDTVARDLVEQVTGDSFHGGHDPVSLLLAWTFDSRRWMQAPLIEIGNAELRGELGLSATQTVYSYSELLMHQPLRLLMEKVHRIEGRKPDPLESKVSDIEQKLVALQAIFDGRAIRLIPDPSDVQAAWRPIRVAKGAEPDAAGAAWMALGAAFLSDNAPAFASASAQLSAALAALPAKFRPDLALIETELHYNRLRPFHLAWIVLAAGTGLALAALGVRRRWFDGLPLLALVGGFGMLSYGLWLRWQIAGRIPASNMFESLLFLSWGMGLFAILAMLVFRDRLVPVTASFMSALSLLLADMLPLDSFVRPIVPVLADTIWMSIHVPVIMVSYSVLALGVLIAHVQLVVMAAAPGQSKPTNAVDSLHYWHIHVGSILLLAGIVTGSMWGASSWGRYWGWDPKEVWSLVALLGYLTILHVRLGREQVPPWAYVVGAALTAAMFVLVVPKFVDLEAPVGDTALKLLAFAGTLAAMAILVLWQGPFAAAVKSILCFWMIIMTYVGVNYVLGTGLHSYGFGTGAVARYMFRLGGADLAITALLAVIYLVRRPGRPPVAVPVPLATPA